MFMKLYSRCLLWHALLAAFYLVRGVLFLILNCPAGNACVSMCLDSWRTRVCHLSYLALLTIILVRSVLDINWDVSF